MGNANPRPVLWGRERRPNFSMPADKASDRVDLHKYSSDISNDRIQ